MKQEEVEEQVDGEEEWYEENERKSFTCYCGEEEQEKEEQKEEQC